MIVNDKIIIGWMSAASVAAGGRKYHASRFYRQLRTGVIPRRPTSQEDAAELLRQAEIAACTALCHRPDGLRGRTPLAAIAAAHPQGRGA